MAQEERQRQNNINNFMGQLRDIDRRQGQGQVPQGQQVLGQSGSSDRARELARERARARQREREISNFMSSLRGEQRVTPEVVEID